ncbi:MAG: hypothetical protein R6X10_18915 [Desulfobacterales bacterium]
MRSRFLILLSIMFLAGNALAVAPPPVPDYQFIPATYSWIDIANPGNDTFIDCDDCSGYRSIGFNFNHYGTIYSGVYISSNGYLSFGAGYWHYSNYDIPNTNTPNNYIAPFWDDLYTSGAGAKIYAATIGTAPNRKFVVTFYDVDWCCGVNNGNLTFQAILSETDGSITFQYQDMLSTNASRGSGNSATIGIENGSGTAGLKYSYNAAGSVTNGLAIQISTDSDTDGDGFPNYWEITYGTDPDDPEDPVATEDVDGDGLDWTEEYAYNTNPFDPDTDNDGVTDGDEVANGTNPAVNDGPVTATGAGPGVEFGTAYYEFSAGPLDPATEGFRVYYGASSGTSINDYDAFLDITNTVDRSGYIDQEWGMNGVPVVYFRIAPYSTIGGLKYVGTPSNELSTYFAGLKEDQATDPQNEAENVIAELDNLNDDSGDDDGTCFIGSVGKSFSCKTAVSWIRNFLGMDKN